MARHLSVEKRARQNIKRNRRNRVVKSAIRGALKQVETNNDPAKTTELTTNAQRILDRAAAKKVLHKNKAAHLKSKIMKKTAQPEKADTTE